MCLDTSHIVDWVLRRYFLKHSLVVRTCHLTHDWRLGSSLLLDVGHEAMITGLDVLGNLMLIGPIADVPMVESHNRPFDHYSLSSGNGFLGTNQRTDPWYHILIENNVRKLSKWLIVWNWEGIWFFFHVFIVQHIWIRGIELERRIE